MPDCLKPQLSQVVFHTSSSTVLPTIMSDAIALPAYSDASIPPAYSLDPSTEEQTLQLTPRSTRHPSSSTTCTKRVGNISIVLKNWATHLGHPCYSQNTLIEGSITLERPEDVRQVSIKVRNLVTSSRHPTHHIVSSKAI